ncbi:MAG: tetratricopeptide repeat protein [Prevotella sp.]|nr:tetratricopeptide repeat protein [Prevotella sp.]MBQ1799319.1 tetratricopeptide repeat protein [Prevotella sp.]MBQ2587705.1 tetratricopeptide repeat protein [Prevotella sp.]
MPIQDKFYESPEFKEKFQLYENAQASGTSVYLEPDDLTDIAEYYHILGNIDACKNTVDYAIKMFPGATMPLVFRSRVALLMEHDVALAEEYAEMIDDKADLEYLYLKAEIMIVDDRAEEAETFLRDAYEELEDDEDKADFLIDVANLYADYELMEYAQQWLSLSEEYDSTDYKELQGRIAMGLGDYEESNRIYNELIDRNPYSFTYWNQLASSQLLHNEIMESIQSSEFALAINPDDEDATLNKANGLFNLGNFEEACKYYERFTKISPNSEVGEMFLGISLINLNRTEEGVEHLKKAESLADAFSEYLHDIYVELAYSLTALGKHEDAMEYIEKISQLDDCDPYETDVLKGNVHLQKGETAEAMKCFQHAVTASNGSPRVILRIGICIYDNGYYSLAYDVFHLLLDDASDEWKDGWSYLALCCMLLSRKDEFVYAVRKACQQNPVEAKMVLGEIFPENLSPDDYVNYLKENH